MLLAPAFPPGIISTELSIQQLSHHSLDGCRELCDDNHFLFSLSSNMKKMAVHTIFHALNYFFVFILYLILTITLGRGFLSDA